MLEYNDTSIISGFIKQYLKSFNLPSLKVYKENDLMIKDQYYIKDKMIVKCKNYTRNPQESDYEKIQDYHYNSKYLNLTKNLKITNNIYDSYTHRYLGDYLRFLRDYKHLDLMSLYNCFDNQTASNLFIKATQTDTLSPVYVDNQEEILALPENYSVVVEDLPQVGNLGFTFNSNDSYSKIYMIPVTLFQNYNIAIDSDTPIECVCGFYDKDQIKEDCFSPLYQHTYMKINKCSFKKPFTYSNLNNLTDDLIIQSKICQYERSLKLFIKVPVSNKSSIVVLETSNVSGNDFILNDFDNNRKEGYIKYNRSVINYEKKSETNDFTGDEKYSAIPLPSRSQLLSLNTSINHPFADRLLEYLTDNVITHLDTIPDNIKRAQRSLYDKNRSENEFFRINHYGIWDDKYKCMLYDLAVRGGLIDNSVDILGYVDKDVEKILGKDIDIYHEDNVSKTSFNNRV